MSNKQNVSIFMTSYAIHRDTRHLYALNFEKKSKIKPLSVWHWVTMKILLFLCFVLRIVFIYMTNNQILTIMHEFLCSNLNTLRSWIVVILSFLYSQLAVIHSSTEFYFSALSHLIPHCHKTLSRSWLDIQGKVSMH